MVHVAGWDTPTALQLLGRLGPAPALHFGDLDPNGARIFFHLRPARPDLRWVVSIVLDRRVEETLVDLVTLDACSDAPAGSGN